MWKKRPQRWRKTEINHLWKKTQVFERNLQILTKELCGPQNWIENIDDANMALDCSQEKFLEVWHSFAPYKESSKNTSELYKRFNNRVKNFFSQRNKIHRQVTNRSYFCCKKSNIWEKRQSEIKKLLSNKILEMLGRPKNNIQTGWRNKWPESKRRSDTGTKYMPTAVCRSNSKKYCERNQRTFH